jgi:putative endopeptidase
VVNLMLSRSFATVLIFTFLLTSACTHHPAQTPQAQSQGKAQIPPWGLDLSARDPAVKPGDDFYHYADGHWLATHSIPADHTRWGFVDELNERLEGQLLSILQALPPNAPAGSNAQKVGDYYRAFVDITAIDAQGLEPARAKLNAIAAARNHRDLTRLMGQPEMALREGRPETAVAGPLAIRCELDAKDPDRYVVLIGQAGLSLPGRDYYLKDDAVYRELRTKYREHIARLLTLIGEPNAQAEAQGILEIETRIAELHWPPAKSRDRDLMYNPRTRAELEQLVPGFDWKTLFSGLGLDAQPQFVVQQLDALQGLGKLFLDVPVDAWRPYFKYHYVVANAAVLPQSIDQETFDFYGRALQGQHEQRSRPTRVVRALDTDLGEALGALYAERFFLNSYKQQVREMVENLRDAYAARIAAVTWMTAATKKQALEKVAAFHAKLGYPDKWRDYTNLTILAGDAFGNSQRAHVFEWQRQVKRLAQPTDRTEWLDTPQTINAMYNPIFNEIIFPAAILQPPAFDPNADPAVNYGGLGAVMGHEMGHGFDDQGSKSDARGVQRSWWEQSDTDAFKQRTDSLVTQYDTFTVLPGLNVNGKLTLAENIGDLSGLSAAYDAYHHSLRGKPAPVRDGLSGDQRFFLAWAQVWRSLERDEAMRSRVLYNGHSPEQFRVNGVVRNMDPWYAAFNVQPGDKLYLPPEERVRIW